MSSSRIFYTHIDSPIGRIYLAASSKGVCRVLLGEDLFPVMGGPRLGTSGDGEVEEGVRLRLERELGLPAVRDEAPCRDLANGMIRYLAGEPWKFSGELDLERGTDFQRRVWDAVRGIPHGEVRSYSWIAEWVGNPKGRRAVGQANGANPIPLIVPCHRVIRSDGRLGGYSAGLALKKRLLALERAFRPCGELENENWKFKV